MWSNVIMLFQQRGHTVVCVTNRALPQSQLDAIMNSLSVKVVYAGDRYKRDALQEDLNMKADIWIDDMPGTIEKILILP